MEDYRHEFLDMEVWYKRIKLVSISGMTCCSKVKCQNQKALEEKLKRLYFPVRRDIKETLDDTQFIELVNIYFEFLRSNDFFENIIWEKR